MFRFVFDYPPLLDIRWIPSIDHLFELNYNPLLRHLFICIEISDITVIGICKIVVLCAQSMNFWMH